MKVIIYCAIFLLISCSPMKPLPDNDHDLVYKEFRFTKVDLFDASEFSQSFNLIYTGTVDHYHLLIALPLNKFSFKKREYLALYDGECKVEPAYPPEMSLFYNKVRYEKWKAIKVEDGQCEVREERYLLDLFL